MLEEWLNNSRFLRTNKELGARTSEVAIPLANKGPAKANATAKSGPASMGWLLRIGLEARQQTMPLGNLGIPHGAIECVSRNKMTRCCCWLRSDRGRGGKEDTLNMQGCVCWMGSTTSWRKPLENTKATNLWRTESWGPPVVRGWFVRFAARRCLCCDDACPVVAI